MKKIFEPLLLVVAILAGIISNQVFTPLSDVYLDLAIYLLLFVVFASIPFQKIIESSKDLSYISTAWIANFVIIPVIAFAIAAVFVEPTSLLFLGLIIYLIAPCTDWVVGFTKLAKGDVERNTILLPINLLTQLLYVFVILFFFSNQTVQLPISDFIDTLLYWIILPFLAAQITLLFLKFLGNKTYNKAQQIAGSSIIFATAILVFTIFFVNTNTVLEHLTLLPTIFVVILLFFIITYYVVRFIAKTILLSREKEVSLAMTTAARNAPLMLGLTLALVPEATIIHTVLIVGMLVEFPHLITLTYLMKK